MGALAAAVAAPAGMSTHNVASPTLQTKTSRFGKLLFDGRGFVLYAFTSDGTTKRLDGKLQVTYAGRPLYYYRGDTKSGYILCQDVFEYGGRWLVVASTGKLVR